MSDIDEYIAFRQVTGDSSGEGCSGCSGGCMPCLLMVLAILLIICGLAG